MQADAACSQDRLRDMRAQGYNVLECAVCRRLFRQNNKARTQKYCSEPCRAHARRIYAFLYSAAKHGARVLPVIRP
jgi:hypothetical protein